MKWELIDWISVGKSSLWLSGLAAILASLSWASWMGARGGTRLRTSAAAPGVQASLNVGLALVSAGLLFSARSAWEHVLWLAFLVWFATQAVGAARAGRPSAAATALGSTLNPCCTADQPIGLLANAAQWVASVEPWLLLALLPFLMFTNRFTPVIAPVLLLPWLARKIARGHLTTRTAVDWPMVILLLMLPVSLWASPDLARSMPKLYGIILGVAVFYGVVNFVRGERHAWMVAAALVLAGPVISAVALLGTNSRLLTLPKAWAPLSRLIDVLPERLRGGFHPNQVGGVLSLLVPLVTSLLFLGFYKSRAIRARHWVLIGLLALSLPLMAGTLVLTQSRSAFLGIAVSLVVLACFRHRWLGLALVLALAAAALVWGYCGPQPIAEWMLALDSDRNIVVRFEIWQRALYIIRDFPYTGAGVNCLPVTVRALYPIFSIPSDKIPKPSHAHNLYLQVALDLGIAGLVAYLAVLLGLVAAWIRVWQASISGPLRALSVGLLCGMLGYHVFSLTDCVNPGAKPGIVVWVAWGLMAALANLTRQRRSGAGG